jgi:hypothetical protein
MKLDMDPFPVVIVELKDKKILVCTDQAPQPGDWRVEGERVVEAGEEGRTHVGYID